MNDTELRSHLELTADRISTSPPPLTHITEQAYSRRRRHRLGVVALITFLMVGASVGWAAMGRTGTDAGIDPASDRTGTADPLLGPIPVPPVPSGVTADGRTYGGGARNRNADQPDLLAVMVDGDGDGTRDDAVAFASMSDFDPDMTTNPQDPLHGWADAPTGYTIPLYGIDGTTVVATYTTETPGPDARAVVSAAAPPGAVTEKVSGPITVDGDCPYLNVADGKHWLILPWGWHLNDQADGYLDAGGQLVTSFDNANLTVQVLAGQRSALCQTDTPPYYVRSASGGQ
jgi:hypothetical protein